jgi:hypothetical protein
MQMNTTKYESDMRGPGKPKSAQPLSKECESAQQDIALAVYGELPDDASHRLEHHLEGCGYCRQELEAVQGLRQAMSLYPMLEPSPNLLTRTRLRLEEALDAVPRSGWMTRIVDRLFNGIARIQSAPAMASVVLICGLGAGGFAGFRAGEKAAVPLVAQGPTTQAPTRTADPQPDGQQVANIRSIVRTPGTENVDISYDRLVPETIHGSLDNDEVRQLLLLGAQSRLDPNVRVDSVGLLAGECRAGHQCGDGQVRDALMVALRRDKDPNVRLKALEGLQPYVGEDMNIRNVVLTALLKDSDPRVRIKAVELLQAVDSDSSVRQALHVAATDDNPYLRTVSRQVLNGLPETQ